MFSVPQTPQAPHSFAQLPSSLNETKPNIIEPDASRVAQTAVIQAKLNRRLGPEYVSQRPAPGGGPKLTYVEGWKIIGLANEVFGYNGWSSSIMNVTTDFCDMCEETKRYSVGVTAMIKVTLRDGTSHEDVGYGTADNLKSKGAALDKAKKEAVTDGMKRALRNFGNLLGLCLYEKSFAQEVVKIKAPPPPKIDKTDLHRRPEYETNVSASTDTSSAGQPAPPADCPKPQSKPHVQEDIKPIPPQGVNGAVHSTNERGRAPQTPMNGSGVYYGVRNLGLNTPNETPASNKYPTCSVQPQPQIQRTAEAMPLQSYPPPRQPSSVSKAPPPRAERIVTFAAPARPPAVVIPPKPQDVEETIDNADDFFTSEDDALFAALDFAAVDGLSELNTASASDSAHASNNDSSKGNNSMKTSGGNTSNRAANGGVGATSESATNSDSNGAVFRAATASASMGEFRFPSGMTPVGNGNRPFVPPAAQRGPPGATSSSTIGVKRPAEAMLPPRRPGQGMGLAQQQTGGNRHRPPLSNLEVGASGDVKRLRR